MRDRFGSKAPKLLVDGKVPITGLGFKQEGREVHLFVASTTEINCFTLTRRDHREVLDESDGCGLHCAVMSDEDTLVVGRTEVDC